MITTIAKELGLKPGQVETVTQLFDEGATIPFIARYRKERTGSLNEVAIAAIRDRVAKAKELAAQEVKVAIKDAYKRLMGKSLEKETMANLKLSADQASIKVFASNIKELLLFPPLGQKRVLAIDPGFRTGCKVVCLDRQGALLHHDVIYPFSKSEKTAKTLKLLTQKYKTEAVAIGRRLMDPLAELVKIDPKSIGVGQYQHDVDQKLLQNAFVDIGVHQDGLVHISQLANR